MPRAKKSKPAAFDPFDEMAAYRPGRSAHDVAGLRGGVPKPERKKTSKKKTTRRKKLSPQEKGWATRRKKAAARSRAAKKAAATRARNKKLKVWQVEFAYDGQAGNSYRLIVFIRPGKIMGEKNVIDLAFSLVKMGHFDFQEPLDPESEYSNDYQWIFPNRDEAFKIKRRMKPRTARLYGFYRD